MLVALISSDTIETLLTELDWSPSTTAERYALILQRALLTE
jgi:hypothetical protein